MRARALVLVVGSLSCRAVPVGESGSGSETFSSESFATSQNDSDTDDGSDTNSESTGPGPYDVPDEVSACERLEQLVAQIESAPSDADVLIGDFVREVGYGEHGFPIVEDHRLCLVALGDDVAALTVAGDFNAWDPEQYPFIEITPELGYVIADLGSTPTGLYKLVRDGSEFFADPLARRFGWDDFGEYSQMDALPDRSHHERWWDFDEGIGLLEPRTITVWLPPGAFDRSPLPVLYMHDGQNLFAPDALWGGWKVGVTLDEAIATDVLAPMIVVGIDNTAARLDEYTQVGDVIDGMPHGGRADEYADFLVDGVKPFIEGRYFAASAPESVAVMGSSLGGLVSLYIGLRHPGVFGQIASLSGTIAWGSIGAGNPTIIDAYTEQPPIGLRIYLDSGGDAGMGCPDDGSDNYCGNIELADTLRGLGWVDEQDLFHRWDPGAPHNEAAWATRLLPALLDWWPE
jgi:predicted alpha/beta superfamily hydrolase